MKEIKLSICRKSKNSDKFIALVSDEDCGELNKIYWHIGAKGYVLSNKGIYLHRFIMQTPKGMDTDHINGNKLDNRRENLRIVNRSQNNMNAKKRQSSSIYKGVSWYKPRQKFKAQITKNSKNYHLGYFLEEHHAAMVYDLNAKELFGEYVKLNFKSI